MRVHNERSENRKSGLTRREFIEKAGLVGLGLAGLPLLRGRVHAAPATPTRGGTLRYGMNTPVASLDPHRFTGAAADNLNGMTYSRLVQLKPDWTGVESDLAQRWEVSSDGLGYTFHLRPNLRFHDGSPVMTEDIVFSFERIMDANTGGYLRPLIADVLQQVTAPTASSVRFVLSKPYAAFMSALALPTAAILSKRWVTGGGNLATTQMGTGPMRFVSIEPNVRITLARHDRYFEAGVPYLEGMILLNLPDDTARATALKTGSVDLIDFVPYREVDAIKSDARLRLHADALSSGLWAFANVNKPPLDKKLVRQAINYAINREAILKAAFFGHGAQMTNIFMPETSWAHDPNLPKYTYDPDKAKSLLRQAEAGVPLKTEVLSASNVLFWRSGSQVFQANLQDVGFDAQLVTPEFAETVKRFYASDYQITMWGGGPLYADPDFLYAYFHSKGTVGRTTGYSNKRMEAILEQARVLSDQPRRKSLYQQVYRILLDDAPWFPMTYRLQAEASSASVQGYNRVLGSNWNGVRIAKTWLAR
jgi:peptide/nickel transport system substrate-binding protein